MLCPLLLRSRTVRMGRRSAGRPDHRGRARPGDFAPIEDGRRLRNASVPFALILRGNLRLRDVNANQRAIMQSFFSFVNRGPFLLVEVRTRGMFLRFNRVRRVNGRRKRATILVHRIRFENVGRQLKRRRLPISLLPSLCKNIIRFRINGGRPSLFFQVVGTGIKEARVNRRAIISPRGGILTRGSKTIAAQGMVIVG